jgi:hemerythrin
MSLVKWDPSYSVKVNRLDDDHKKLFAMINDLHDSMLAGHGKDKVQEIVKKLADYTRYHFAAEEAYFEKTKYPALASHRAEHQAFVKRVEQFQQDIASGKGGQSISIGIFLNEWLTSHIKNTDQKYSAHLNANGVR